MSTAVCSSGKGFAKFLPGARFIFPTSKRRRSSAFSRAKLTQWFDIVSLSDPSYRRHTQVQGLEESFQVISGLVNQEIDKVSAKHVVLGGISQGAAMATICLLAMKFPIGGFIGMSTWMPYREDIQSLLSEEIDGKDDDNPFENSQDDFFAPEDSEQVNLDPIIKAKQFVQDLVSLGDTCEQSVTHTSIATPVFLGHGSADDKITIDLGRRSRDTLRDIGFDVTWAEYEGQGHWYKIPEEIDDIAKFLRDDVGWPLN
jgi:predicted esterase